MIMPKKVCMDRKSCVSKKAAIRLRIERAKRSLLLARLNKAMLSPQEYEISRKEINDRISIHSKQMKSLEEKARENKNPAKSRNLFLAIAIAVVLILAASFIPLGGSPPAGLVVYDIVRLQPQPSVYTFDSSGEIPLELSEGTNGISISGAYTGDSDSKIYLIVKDRTLDIGTVSAGQRFESLCNEACYFERPPGAKVSLKVDMPDGGLLRISTLTERSSSLIEFDLDPKKVELTLKRLGPHVQTFTLHNPRDDNITVLLDLKGPLARYITLQRSLIRLNSTAKQETYSISIPDSETADTLEAILTVRYVPEGPYTGELPTEDHKIIVHLSSDLEMMSPPSGGGILLKALIIVLGLSAVLFTCYYIISRKNKV